MKYELRRGGVLLGIVTLDPDESQHSFNAGWLEPAEEFVSVKSLFEREDQLHNQLVEAELSHPFVVNNVEAECLRLAAEQIQAEIIQIGVQMRPLTDHTIGDVVEIHIESN